MEPSAVKFPELEKLRIVYYPDPALKKVCAPVDEVGPDHKRLAQRMLALMREAKGVGLAAPQVGISVRLFVCNVSGEEGADLVCVNPRFGELTGAEESEEGCLSIPGVTVTMRRATHVEMEALDGDGKPFKKTAVDMEARIWQHEVDHIDGRLITDNMSITDQIGNRRAVKQLEAEYAAARRR